MAAGLLKGSRSTSAKYGGATRFRKNSQTGFTAQKWRVFHGGRLAPGAQPFLPEAEALRNRRSRAETFRMVAGPPVSLADPAGESAVRPSVHAGRVCRRGGLVSS